MIYTTKQIVKASMVDTKANLSILGTYQVIEDAITELMGQYKVDNITLKDKYNALWVFTKTKIKFIKKLKWNENFVVNSYISLISTVKINLSVEIIDKNNEIAIYSKTELCALDIDTQRIRKISTVGVDDSMLEEKHPIEIVFNKLDGVNLPLIDKVQIKYTNIDFAHHTNNLEYVRIIMNTYNVAQIENQDIKEMEIIYLNQSFENDILNIRKSNFNDKDIVVLEKDSQPIVKCEISF